MEQQMDPETAETIAKFQRKPWTILSAVLAVVSLALIVLMIRNSGDRAATFHELKDQIEAKVKLEARNAELTKQVEGLQAQLASQAPAAKSEPVRTGAKAPVPAPAPVAAAKTTAAKPKLPDSVAVIIHTLYESGQIAVEKERMAKTIAKCGEDAGLELSLCVRAYEKQKTGPGYNVKMGSLIVAKEGMDAKRAGAVAICFAANMPKDKDAEGNVIKNIPEAVDPAAFTGDCL